MTNIVLFIMKINPVLMLRCILDKYLKYSILSYNFLAKIQKCTKYKLHVGIIHINNFRLDNL